LFMWTVNQKDFLLLRDAGGQLFTAFVDALLRAHGFVYGVGEAEILTSLRTNIADGGVDTEIQRAMPGEPTGFLLEPTCWQYKAREYADITDAELLKEIKKRYARELLERGYAYRLAICDDMPAEKQTAWEQLLTDLARQINPQAPVARVATASQLASWANAYPALLPAHFRYDSGPVLYFEAWSRNITKVTPSFVRLEAWKGTASLVENHINLIQQVIRATLPLQGVAGVGKTRLVHEVIASLGCAQDLVLYTTDGDDAENVARSLANDPKTRCILIADECPVAARVNIGKMLKGHTDRVRVVCIDNSGERPVGGEEELRLKELAPDSVDQVLAKNFPHVPADRRRAYAELSGGYIRFAADMCEHHAEIETKGHLGPALATVEEYYLDRFPGEKERRAVEAIALVQKVGFGEGVSEELDALCGLTRQTPQQVLEIAAALKDAPGFVVRTSRYLYITPEIIARVAFAYAWRRWIEGDPDAFLRRIPPILLESFQARVARSAPPEVRARTGQFFWGSVTNLKPSDLADENSMDRLATLIDTDPDAYFPRLALLVREASPEELRESKGGLGRRGTRRTLVWTAEHLAAFPKYFLYSEEILRRLALAETEEQIGNNATGVWKELFRIQVSGAATPFPERIELLRHLIFSSSPDESALALEALEETLNFRGTRLVGPSVVAGQLVPPDWRPRTSKEFQDCLKLILSLYDRVFEEGTADMRQRAWPTFAKHIRPLLWHGTLPTLKAIVQRRSIPDAFLPDVLESLEEFLQYECRAESGQVADDPWCREVAEWVLALTPSDFIGRLKAVVGKAPWRHSIREQISGIPSEIIPLAEELNRDPVKLEAVLPYLNSPDAASTGLLGEALARLDADGQYMDRILSTAVESGSNALARGYIGRLVATYPNSAERLSDWLDRLENQAPELAYFVSLTAPEFGSPLARTLRLIRDGKLPVQSLQNFIAGVLLDRMTSGDLSTVLDLLVQAGDARSLHIAVDFVGHSIQKDRKSDATEREAMWRVLEASASVEDRADYWWARALENFAPGTPERACSVAIVGLTGNDYEKRNAAWSILSSLAKMHPDLVMDGVGKILLDKERGWRLRTDARSGLFQALPLESVQRWLSVSGIEGARVIANHLQPPFLDDEGKPQVHPLTEYVLVNWGHDKEVFGRFVASTHHLQMYSGDIAATHRKEADQARLFLSHSIPAVRKWAEHEVNIGEREAREWTTLIEEQDL
jgi:hypothetical protein